MIKQILMMRAKFKLTGIDSSPTQETIHMMAVTDKPFDKEGNSEDNSFARWTPGGTLSITIQNPALVGKPMTFKSGWHWFRLHCLPATKFDLKELEHKIMALGDDLIAAATTLSTAADALSVKTDSLITAAEAVIAALKGASGLPPGAADALAKMNASIATAKTTGSKLDTEVANLDAVLPTPAPPATP